MDTAEWVSRPEDVGSVRLWRYVDDTLPGERAVLVLARVHLVSLGDSRIERV